MANKKVAKKKVAKKKKTFSSQPKPETKPTIGRPKLYSKNLAYDICKQLSQGKTLTAICHEEGYPSISTVMSWLWEESEIKASFLENYRIAREMQVEVWSDEIVDISNDDTHDEIFTEDGRRLENREFTSRSKLRVNTKQWLMAKRMPKKYGERSEQSIHHMHEDNFINALKSAAQLAWS